MLGGIAADLEVSPSGAIKSPAAALAEVRRLRSEGKIPPGRQVTISVAAGDYELKEELDVSGNVAPVAFIGAKKGVSRFSGGRTLGPFQVGKDGVWRCKVPDGLVFEQLWVNGTRVVRARSPNKFYHYVKAAGGEGPDPVTGQEANLNGRAFYADPEDIACLTKIPADELDDVAIHFWWSWNTEWGRPLKVDLEKGYVNLKKGVTWGFFTWRKFCPRFIIENCRSVLDAPGEWFLDRKKSELLYIPRPGEKPETTYAVAPAMSRIVHVHDADGVTFERITFEYNGWMGLGNGAYESQSAYISDAAIIVRDSANVNFRNCRVRHTADYGIWFAEGTRDSSVYHSMLDDLGAGGIRLGARKWSPEDPPEKVVRGVTVDDNIIHSGGHVFPAGTGVWMTFVRDCTVTHNEIFDFYYSGICMGWTWGYKPQPNRNNEISWNHIHHLGKGVLSDMGFIYTLGDNTGSKIVCNHGHDIFSYDYTGFGGEGLYPDEGSANILWASNLIHHSKSAALSLHYGKNNVFVNNIFAYSAMTNWSLVGRFRPQEHVQLVCSNNVFVWKSGCEAWRGSISGRTATVKDIVFGSNLWWCPDGISSNAFNGTTWEKWRESGMDAGSVIADPLFRDSERGDWRLKPGSPAFGIGFKEWDYSLAGVRKEDPAWRAKAASLVPTGYPDVPVPPRNLGPECQRSGFETIKAGTFPRILFINNSDVPRAGYVQVTDKEHRSGKQSLEIKDDAQKRPKHDPKFLQRFRITSDKFVFRYSLKCDDKAFLTCRMMACAPTENKGPEALRVTVKDGRLSLAAWQSEKEYANYAVGKWNDLVFTIHAPKGATPTFDFSLAADGGKAQETKGLRFREAGCPVPSLIAFESNAACETKSYLDDYSFENIK